MSGTTGVDCHSLEESEAALQALTRAEKAKLYALARIRSVGVPGQSPDDLLQDAFERVLRGSRLWPQGVSFMRFLDQVLRSVASERRRAIHRRRAILDVTNASGVLANGDDDPPDVIAVAPGDHKGSDETLIAKQTVERIEALFPEEHLLGVLLWRAEGYTAQEIREEFNMDEAAYDNATKLIYRRLLKFKDEQKG